MVSLGVGPPFFFFSSRRRHTRSGGEWSSDVCSSDLLRASGDSCGARVNVVASGVPVGWGEPVYDRLDADIAYAMMGINAVKGVEIGAGFGSGAQRGSEHGDELTPEGFLSNNAGGMLGGISTGQDIAVHLALKPTSSIRIPRKSIDKQGKPVTVETTGRHDPC